MMIRIFILLLAFNWSCCFNTATNEATIVYATKPDDEKPSFFGYNIKFGAANNKSFVVGAPKTKGKDKVFTCPISSLQNKGQSCAPLSNPPSQSGNPRDGLTLTISDHQDLLACQPGRLLNCSNKLLVPGFCYKKKKNEKNWARIYPLNATAFCPKVPSKLDLIFLLDSSGSVGKEGFNSTRHWVQNVSRSFNIKNGSTQIGVITYSLYRPESSRNKQKYTKTRIQLGQYRDREEFNRVVQAIPYEGTATYTAHALNYTVEDFKKSPRYSDPLTTKVLVLLTDGNATSGSPDFLPATSRYVRSLGIKILAVGVGKKINANELRLIATGTNTNDGVYFVSNYSTLDDITQELETVIRTISLEGSGLNPGVASSQHEFGETGFSSAFSKNNVICSFAEENVDPHQTALYCNYEFCQSG